MIHLFKLSKSYIYCIDPSTQLKVIRRIINSLWHMKMYVKIKKVKLILFNMSSQTHLWWSCWHLWKTFSRSMCQRTAREIKTKLNRAACVKFTLACGKEKKTHLFSICAVTTPHPGFVTYTKEWLTWQTDWHSVREWGKHAYILKKAKQERERVGWRWRKGH